MKQLILSLCVLLVTTSVSGDEKLYRKIERKMKRDSVKGMLYAKKLKSKKSTEPDAYYFLSKSYLASFHHQSRRSKQYSALNRSASDAYRMKKYATNQVYLKNKQSKLVTDLGVQLAAFRDTFLRLKDYDRSERLAKHYYRVTGKRLPTLEQLDSIDQEKKKEAKLLLQVSRVLDGKYYGMPTGEEDVGPFNFQGEQELLRLINRARVQKGLEPLKWSFGLSRAARYHANDMATQRYFDHSTYDRIDGKLVKIGGTFPRIRKFYDLRFVNSENIAAGSELAKDTYRQWYNSKGHYANMFNTSSKYVGIGMAFDAASPYKYYWVFCTAR